MLLKRMVSAWRTLCGTRPSRKVLPSRRDCQHFDFEFENHRWTASYAWLPDGNLAEIFLVNSKAGSGVEAYAQDMAVAVSIALQYGAPTETIRAAVGRNSRGEPRSPVGAALDILAGVKVYERPHDPLFNFGELHA